MTTPNSFTRPGSSHPAPLSDAEKTPVIPVVAVPRSDQVAPPDGSPPVAFSAAEATALAISASQRMALEKILSGHTLVASAAAAGVTRFTLHRWLKKDPKFQAAFNAWSLDVVTSGRTKILAMSDNAVNTVGRAVKTDPKIAVTVLKAIGILDRPTPGSTDAEEIAEKEQKREQDKMEQEFEDAAMAVLEGKMTHAESVAKLEKKYGKATAKKVGAPE